MSISLDLALLLRDSQNKFGLSLASIGVLYTLAHRVGTKSNTWIKQTTLAKELGITTRGLRKHHIPLAQSKLILIKPDKKDQRKYTYSFNPVFLNYHQKLKDEEWIKNCHKKLGSVLKNKGTKVPLNAQDTGTKVPLNTGTKGPLILDVQTPQDLEPRGFPNDVQIPKATYENNIQDKVTKISCAKGFAHAQEVEASFNEFWNTYPRKKNKERTRKIWTTHKLYELKEKIIADVKERTKKEQQWQTFQFIPHPSTYLNNKLWTDDIESGKKNTSMVKENSVVMAFNHILGKKS